MNIPATFMNITGTLSMTSFGTWNISTPLDSDKSWAALGNETTDILAHAFAVGIIVE